MSIDVKQTVYKNCYSLFYTVQNVHFILLNICTHGTYFWNLLAVETCNIQIKMWILNESTKKKRFSLSAAEMLMNWNE